MALSGDFNHPFKPYDIQLQLMGQVYSLLEKNKKIGIFESPTGTGKTLSLICPTVTWLRQNKVHLLDKKNKTVKTLQKTTNGLSGTIGDDGDDDDDDSDDEPAWVKEAFVESILKERVRAIQEYEEHLDSQSFSLDAASVLSAQKQPASKKSRTVAHTPVVFEDSEFLPEEDSSTDLLKEQGDTDDKTKLNNEVQALLGKLNESQKVEKPKESNLPSPIKIFFASRTHSQLSQFAAQLRLPNFPSSIEHIDHERIKFVPLASRKQLCINQKVSQAASNAINDCCADAINKKDCTPYSRSKDPANLRNFRDYTFHAVHDIEDMVAIGQATNTCPYYALREVIHDGVEVVTMPYQHLLMDSTRDALGIDLKDSIVIIDEAHNVIDTINMMNSAEISLSDLESSKTGIATYTRKFVTRLNPENRVNLRRLLTLIDVLIDFIKKRYKNGREFESFDVFDGTNADVLNIHNLERYMKTTKIAFKVDSYIEHQQLETNLSTLGRQPVLFKVAAFLRTLSNPSAEGRFFFEKNHSMKYMLLEPSHSFERIVELSKCVILAGGTMEPISEFTANLIPFVDESQICKFSCNHVIPDDNLNTFVVGENFEFTFDRREDPKMLTELYNFFSQLALIVPDGIVVFMPSYKYLESVLSFWRSNLKMNDKISNKKVFHEAAESSEIFGQYSAEIDLLNGGAILFAVVGGRLSEGINFQDGLARAVVMVGLPFPNVFSGELIIKRKHLEQKVISNGGSIQDAKLAAREFYENMCMKAVNQSIGRAIRHASDYANIYLLDKRYGSSQTQGKLSKWVRKRICKAASLQEVYDLSAAWFSAKKKK
ncbi:LANO_0B02168g1_1 [Lachancea nothofagi CBS 11611]|uniref:ATP-dependent DNA helicase CHL1 n=1 Tax=Lachancea nothofagi CBS 11611 TaxID=1266666 RepID=A0A1G4IVR9_9SACH|nr:LANO_0B02168g1_1 [Lachancea nothofagi CBS 11611]